MQSSSRFTKIFKCMVNLTNLKTTFNLSAKIYIKLATKYRGLNQPSISITWSKILKTDQENNLTSLVQQRELKWDGEGGVVRVKSKLCVGEIWSGHTHRLDVSCTLGSYGGGSQSTGRSPWEPTQVGCGTAKAAKRGLDGRRPARTAHGTGAPLCPRDPCLTVRGPWKHWKVLQRAQQGTRALSNHLRSLPLGRSPPTTSSNTRWSLKWRANLSLLSEGKTGYPLAGGGVGRKEASGDR